MTTKTSPARDSKGRYVKKTTTITTTTTTTTTTTAPAVLKNYIGISRDHSASMGSIARPAARDYNANIQAIKTNSENLKQDTIVSVVKCGSYGAGGRYGNNPYTHNGVVREIVNSSISKLQPLNESDYDTSYGSTPLFDSVGDLITQFETAPDANDPNVSFLVMAITDGGENSSRVWNASRIAQKIQQLTATDRWSFVFRVPRGYSRELTRLGIPAGNILEWDQTERGVEVATRATEQAFTEYYSQRSRGLTSTKGFYTTDLSGVKAATVKARLVDISGEVKFFDVSSTDQIKPFVERNTGKSYVAGTAFYQLMKKESEVQDYKQIALREKKSGKVYSGVEARNLLGLPHNGTVQLTPGNHGMYDIFIESTSVNRKLIPGTQVLYWAGAKGV
jgi:hypothetical protein